MDSLDVNKGIAAFLVAGIAFFITGLLGDNLVFETRPAKPALAIQGATETGAPVIPTGPAPIVPLLASADVTKGDTFVHQVCAACHSLNDGGKPIVGPNLYGIVDAPHDHEAGFDYSAALEKYKGQPWTYQALNKWLFDPQTYAPGTHMTYTGIKNTKQRADVIAYLRTLATKPEPLPTKAEVAAAEKTKAAPATETSKAAAAATGGLPPLAPLLASANVSKGDAFVHTVCGACHSLNQGGKPIVGPNLYGIVGAPHDHESGFDYSAALEKFKGQPWTYAALNKWLDDPQTYAPGTHMTYTGVKSAQQRADVIAYLRTLSPNPEPLPKVAGPPQAAENAPAPGSAAPAGNHSAFATSSAPNSAPASSPETIGPPAKSYNPAAQSSNGGTRLGGTGATPPPTAPAPPATTP